MQKEKINIKQSNALKGFLFRAYHANRFKTTGVEDPEQQPLSNTIMNGFTLIELLVVVLIIGILAAIALPQYQKAVEKARAAEAVTILKILRDQQALCFLEHGIGDNRCGQGEEDIEGNLFTMANIKISGEEDPLCEDPLCGPSSEFFTYSLDGETIFSNRKPYGTKYYLWTSAHPRTNDFNVIKCTNDDENKNWCNIIGFTKQEGDHYMQP